MRLEVAPDIVAIQESKCNEVSDKWVELIWGSPNFQYVQKPKVEKSGGMLLIWDPTVFAVNEVHFLAIKGTWKGKFKQSIIVNVYGLHKDKEKKLFWDSLEDLMNYSDAEWVIGGDFNEVRTDDERQNCEFIERRAKLFNNFIEKNHLIEIPLIGKRFTRISDDGKKFSKLDRFLVSNNFLQSWGEVSDADSVIVEAWNKMVVGSRPDCVFRNKLKNVKEALRVWSKFKYGSIDEEIKNWKSNVSNFESKADLGILTEAERSEWLNARAKWNQKKKEKTGMLKQKARIKWATDGDENTSFFHYSIQRNINSSKIRGLHINGIWEENPTKIKDEVYDYFRKIFEDAHSVILDYSSIMSLPFSRITPEDVTTLEAPFFESEIWNTIRDLTRVKHRALMVLT
ncbi:uncharacterized protein [Rutidosis leptorrhynchoides]|uniref:uncharacterized protein n=1 Tax=Rutidosis leptorrhynchoides TaxID=125765 RepID=UPI003A98F7B0